MSKIVHPSAEKLMINWKVIDNIKHGTAFFISQLTIQNNDTKVLGNKGWELYFSFGRVVLPDGEEGQNLAKYGIKLTSYSGDIYKIEPTETFKVLSNGESLTIELIAKDWAIMKGDAPAGFHIVYDKSEKSFAVNATVGEIIKSEQYKRHSDDLVPLQTPEIRYNENQADHAVGDINSLSLKQKLVPQPYQLEENVGNINLKNISVIAYEGDLENEAKYLQALLKDIAKIKVSIKSREVLGNAIVLKIGKKDLVAELNKPEAYKLAVDIDNNSIFITGNDNAGVFYGVQTLRQLVPVDVYKSAVESQTYKEDILIPNVVIKDAPRFHYRGMMLDVVRHFQPKDTVLKLLDLLAYHKINTFHFHLVDDEGWRFEIKSLPELTSYGAHRGFDPEEKEMMRSALGSSNDRFEAKEKSLNAKDDHIRGKQNIPESTLNFVGKGSGYYTHKEFVEILKYAKERHINVIPELDMPGHARAAIKAMEYRFKTKNDASYRLIETEDKSEYLSVQFYDDNIVNPCIDSTYKFLIEMVKSVKEMYDQAAIELPYIHIGGDEVPEGVWEKSPACQKFMQENNMSSISELKDYFLLRFSKIIKEHAGARMLGWDDVLFEEGKMKAQFAEQGFIPLSWNNIFGWGGEDNAYRLANAGYDIIMASATNLYFDLAYNKDPDETGYYWAGIVDAKKSFQYYPFNMYDGITEDHFGNKITEDVLKNKERLTEEGKKRILGVQGFLWSENTKSPQIMEYQAFPKLLGVADRAWNMNMPSKQDMPKAWAIFSAALGQHALPLLDYFKPVGLKNSTGVCYRIPLPGAKIEDNLLHANVRYAGLVMEYSLNNGEEWLEYNDADKPQVFGEVLLRTRAARKDGVAISSYRHSRVCKLTV
jgi:hexosaminidase